MAVATGVAATKPVAKVAVVVVDGADAVTDQPKANVSVLMPRASLCPLMWMWRYPRHKLRPPARKRPSQKPVQTARHATLNAASVATAVSVVSAVVANAPKALNAVRPPSGVHHAQKDVASAVLTATVVRTRMAAMTWPTKSRFVHKANSQRPST